MFSHSTSPAIDRSGLWRVGPSSSRPFGQLDISTFGGLTIWQSAIPAFGNRQVGPSASRAFGESGRWQVGPSAGWAFDRSSFCQVERSGVGRSGSRPSVWQYNAIASAPIVQAVNPELPIPPTRQPSNPWMRRASCAQAASAVSRFSGLAIPGIATSAIHSPTIKRLHSPTIYGLDFTVQQLKGFKAKQ